MSVPVAVQAAWDSVVAHWDDRAKHTALLGLVAQHSCFAWAAARYKERAGDPIADEQLERLRSSAVATMFATASSSKREQKPYRSTLFLLIALALAVVLGLVALQLIQQTTPH